MALGKKHIFQFLPYMVIGLVLIALPSFVGLAVTSLFTKVLIFSLAAMSLDFIAGYTGLWSFCQAAIFGVGAYTTGILITRFDITSFWLSAPAGILMAGFVACVFGFIALRVSALYFLLITFALGQLVYSIAFKWRLMTGGSDGIRGVPYPDMGILSSWSPTSFYYLTLVVVAICTFLLYRLIKSPFGLSLQSIRENETRVNCLGCNTWLFKYIAFVISGLFAGLAGVLYIYFNGAISPPQIGMAASATLFLMIIIGGIGTLWGAPVGTMVLLLFQYYMSIIVPIRWPMVLGVLFVVFVIFLRGGIFPHMFKLWLKVKQV